MTGDKGIPRQLSEWCALESFNWFDNGPYIWHNVNHVSSTQTNILERKKWHCVELKSDFKENKFLFQSYNSVKLLGPFPVCVIF